jgi:hypothetical protein
MPLFTALGFLMMPLVDALMIFIYRNPELSLKLGLISAKANIIANSATDWPAYLKLIDMSVAIAGFFLFCLITSWVFGREFSDGTLKDLLAVPVPRASILLAKFIGRHVACSANSPILCCRPPYGAILDLLARLRGDLARQRPPGDNRLPGDRRNNAICLLRQRGARLPAAIGGCDSHSDRGEPGRCGRVGGILPLVGARVIPGEKPSLLATGLLS